MMAKKKVIETIKLEDLGIVESDSGRIILHSQNPPTEKEPGQIFEGVSEIPTIIAKLRNEANVI
jgi:electron transfer flavoprotein alpha/beta subunit